MNSFQANLILLITALIWGFGFVAQRMGMDHLGPYAFNVCRFLVGALSFVIVCRVFLESVLSTHYYYQALVLHD